MAAGVKGYIVCDNICIKYKAFEDTASGLRKTSAHGFTFQDQ